MSLTVSRVTTLHEVSSLLDPTTSRVGQLERPEERVRLLEVGANGVDLVNEVLNTDNAVLAQMLLNHAIVCDRDALLVDLCEPSLVDEFLHGLEVRVPKVTGKASRDVRTQRRLDTRTQRRAGTHRQCRAQHGGAC